MENQEIDATKANLIPDEESMLNIINSAIGSAYDKDKLLSDIRSGNLKASDIMSNPAILGKYLVQNNG